MAQSVEPPTSAQVLISQFMSSSPASGSVLMAQSLEPASNSVSPSLSGPPPLRRALSLSLSLSLSKINIKKNKNKIIVASLFDFILMSFRTILSGLVKSTMEILTEIILDL